MTDTVAGPDPDPSAGSPSASDAQSAPVEEVPRSPVPLADGPPPVAVGDGRPSPGVALPASIQMPARPQPSGDWSFSSTTGFDDSGRGLAPLTYDPNPYDPTPAFEPTPTYDLTPRQGPDAGPDPQPDSRLRPLVGPREGPRRHPMDPDTAPSTKAAAVLALGVAALITGPLVGGLVPATLALLLARQAQAELVAGRGYLTGARQIRLGLALAWTGIALAVLALVVALILGIISLADVNVRDFPDSSD